MIEWLGGRLTACQADPMPTQCTRHLSRIMDAKTHDNIDLGQIGYEYASARACLRTHLNPCTCAHTCTAHTQMNKDTCAMSLPACAHCKRTGSSRSSRVVATLASKRCATIRDRQRQGMTRDPRRCKSRTGTAAPETCNGGIAQGFAMSHPSLGRKMAKPLKPMCLHHIREARPETLIPPCPKLAVQSSPLPMVSLPSECGGIREGQCMPELRGDKRSPPATHSPASLRRSPLLPGISNMHGLCPITPHSPGIPSVSDAELRNANLRAMWYC